MITLILLALLLTLIQLMTPALLNSKNLEFLISNREGSVEEAPIVGLSLIHISEPTRQAESRMPSSA